MRVRDISPFDGSRIPDFTYMYIQFQRLCATLHSLALLLETSSNIQPTALLENDWLCDFKSKTVQFQEFGILRSRINNYACFIFFTGGLRKGAD